MRTTRIFFLLPFLTPLTFSYELSGVITIPPASGLGDVQVTITALPGDSLIDTDMTDTTGYYELVFSELGGYRIVLEQSTCYPKDTTIMLPAKNTTMNFTMISLPVGTYHEGNVGGVWLPSDNPHRIATSITIMDSLYIAPGCTVLTAAGASMQLNGKLRIGSSTGSRTSLTITLLSGVYPVEIENATIIAVGPNPCNSTWGISCSDLTVKNCDITTEFSVAISAGTIHCDHLVVNETCQQSGRQNYTTIRFTGSNELSLVNTSVFTHDSWITLDGGTIYIDKSTFSSNTEVLSDSRILYSHFSNSLSIDSPRDFKIFISHSLLGNFGYHVDTSMNDTIIDNIFSGTVNVRGSGTDTIYTSPFSYNIIRGGITYHSSEPYYFGLLKNITVNTNGDSCDMWYNMQTDIGIKMTCSDSIECFKNIVGSKALQAGSEQSNIGPDQGEPIAGIKERNGFDIRRTAVLTNGISIVSSTNFAVITFYLKNPVNAAIEIVSLQGRLIKTVSRSPFDRGKHQLIVTTSSLPAGSYGCRLQTDQQVWLKKLVVLR